MRLSCIYVFFFFFFQAEDGIRDFCLSRGLGDVYKRQMFDRLDQIVYRYRNGLQKKEDAVFLKEQGITDTALLIALRIPGDDAARQKELFAQITADKKALDGTTADTVTV